MLQAAHLELQGMLIQYKLHAGCYPYTDKDPFVIDTCPHVYFCANQDKFASRLLKGKWDYEDHVDECDCSQVDL